MRFALLDEKNTIRRMASLLFGFCVLFFLFCFFFVLFWRGEEEKDFGKDSLLPQRGTLDRSTREFRRVSMLRHVTTPRNNLAFNVKLSNYPNLRTK